MVSLLHVALLEATVADLDNYNLTCSRGIADPVSSTAPPIARPECFLFFESQTDSLSDGLVITNNERGFFSFQRKAKNVRT